ncbi:uncharacterized protein [Epargyreus clarus]|uniref:uncharacterized protein n=1 Tax=Epargyreus clarus TaxID=520877 RepID=UPI003C2AFA04
MGSSQSVRSTHFQHPNTMEADPEDEPEEHHISISNKMVERLVEDATLGSATATSNSAPPRGDYKDKIFMEKLKCLDDSHSERSGLTVEDLNALAARIELRTANMISVDPVCAECKERIIDCYNNTGTPADTVKCWETIGAFTQCVRDASTQRLRARTEREARETARRSRHVAHAREHALKDLTPAAGDSATV